MEHTAPPASKTSGLAIVSLITGLTCIAPAAIICGHIAMSNIKESAGKLSGGGLALAGTILGYVGIISYLLTIPTLFVGARAWKKGSDRAACIMTQRNIQQVVRAHQAENGLQPGAPLNIQSLLSGITTTCPAGGTITLSETVPPTGVLVGQCSHADDLGHVYEDHSTW